MKKVSENTVKKYLALSCGLGTAFVLFLCLVIGLWVVMKPDLQAIINTINTSSTSASIYYLAISCSVICGVIFICLVGSIIMWKYSAQMLSFQDLERKVGSVGRPQQKAQAKNPIIVNINRQPANGGKPVNVRPNPNVGPRPVNNAPKANTPLITGPKLNEGVKENNVPKLEGPKLNGGQNNALVVKKEGANKQVPQLKSGSSLTTVNNQPGANKVAPKNAASNGKPNPTISKTNTGRTVQPINKNPKPAPASGLAANNANLNKSGDKVNSVKLPPKQDTSKPNQPASAN